jgi:hypothetical protein
MTRTSRNSEGPEVAGGEPMLEEMATFRRLVALESAAPEDKQRVFARARSELLARPEQRAGWKLGRPWGIALLALGTSTALAATPPGRQLVSAMQGAVGHFLSGETKTGTGTDTDTLSARRSTARQEGRVTSHEPVRPEETRSAADARARDARAAEGTAAGAVETGTLAPLPDLPVGVAGRPGATGSRGEGARAPRPATQTEREAKQLEAEERKLVEQARFALGQKRYADAQALSAEHRRRFPDGKLGPERNAIERQVANALAPDAAPGTTAPGTTAPGTTAPGTTAPGTTAPGTTAPGTGSINRRGGLQ